MSSPAPDEHFGIIPAVNRIRELLDLDRPLDFREVRSLLDHIEDVTRDRVKARGQDRSPVLVTVKEDEASEIFDEAIDFLSDGAYQQRM